MGGNPLSQKVNSEHIKGTGQMIGNLASIPRAVVDLTRSSSPHGPIEEIACRTDEALGTAIENASPKRLRQALRKVCTSSTNAKCIARNILLGPSRQASQNWNGMSEYMKSKPQGSEGSEESEESGESAESEESEGSEELKESEGSEERLAQFRSRERPAAVAERKCRLAICKQCWEFFDVIDNRERRCRYHPGKTLHCLSTRISLTFSRGERVDPLQ